MLRNKIINFLAWNDRNGCYTDEDCILEGLEPLTFVGALKLFVQVMAELDSVDFCEINITEEFRKNPKVYRALMIIKQCDSCISTFRKAIDAVN